MRRAGTHKRKLYLRKRYFFVIEKYVEDVKQDEKSIPDLVESIMRPPGLVKEELRRKTMKMSQFRPKFTKIGACIFEMSGKILDSANVATSPVILTPFHPILTLSHTFFAIFSPAKYFEKMWVSVPLGLVTLVTVFVGHACRSAVRESGFAPRRLCRGLALASSGFPAALGSQGFPRR